MIEEKVEMTVKETPAAAATAAGKKEKITERGITPHINYSKMPERCQVVEITRQEYDMLQYKATRYDMLKDIAVKSTFVTDTESIIFGIDKYGGISYGKE